MSLILLCFYSSLDVSFYSIKPMDLRQELVFVEMFDSYEEDVWYLEECGMDQGLEPEAAAIVDQDGSIEHWSEL